LCRWASLHLFSSFFSSLLLYFQTLVSKLFGNGLFGWNFQGCLLEVSRICKESFCACELLYIYSLLLFSSLLVLFSDIGCQMGQQWIVFFGIFRGCFELWDVITSTLCTIVLL
jgi:hypothetical protein